jgi:hypothetical protein
MHSDLRRFFGLAVVLTTLVSSSCSQAGQQLGSAAPSPSASVTSSEGIGRSGVLREVAPGLSMLTAAHAVEIDRSWTGYAPVTSTRETYQLMRGSEGFSGEARFRAETRSGRVREATHAVTVPIGEMLRILQQLGDVSLEERTYKPSQPVTDTNPNIGMRVTLVDTEVRFFTSSQGPENVPWGVEYAGRTFVVESPAIAFAINDLEPYLANGVMRDMTLSLEEEERRDPPRPRP